MPGHRAAMTSLKRHAAYIVIYHVGIEKYSVADALIVIAVGAAHTVDNIFWSIRL